MSDVEHVEGGGTLDDLVRSVLTESENSAATYLRQRWIAAAISSLEDARRKANLTQAEVAARMGTTQSSIARLEHDFGGGISLRRYLDYALACGALPAAPELKPVEEFRALALSHVGTSPSAKPTETHRQQTSAHPARVSRSYIDRVRGWLALETAGMNQPQATQAAQPGQATSERVSVPARGEVAGSAGDRRRPFGGWTAPSLQGAAA